MGKNTHVTTRRSAEAGATVGVAETTTISSRNAVGLGMRQQHSFRPSETRKHDIMESSQSKSRTSSDQNAEATRSPATAFSSATAAKDGPSSSLSSSPLRVIVAQQAAHRRRFSEEGGECSDGVPHSTQNSSHGRLEEKSPLREKRGGVPVEEDITLHPCQLQGGCHTTHTSTAARRKDIVAACPYREHPSITCLETIAQTSGTEGGSVGAHPVSPFCHKWQQGCCPWYHDEPSSGLRLNRQSRSLNRRAIYQRLFECIYLHGDLRLAEGEEYGGSSSLCSVLQGDAETAAVALCVFVDVAVMAMEAAVLQGNVSDSNKREVQEDPWLSLLKALRDFSSTEEGSLVQVISVVHPNTTPEKYSKCEEHISFQRVAMHVSVLQPNSSEEEERGGGAEWLSGPVASSLFFPCSVRYGNDDDGEDTMLAGLSPLLHGWLVEEVDAVLHCFSSTTDNESHSTPPRITMRRRLQRAVHHLLGQRLKACEVESAHLQEERCDIPLPLLSSPSEIALSFVKDAVVWSHLMIETGEEEEGPVAVLTTMPAKQKRGVEEEGLDKTGHVPSLRLSSSPAALLLRETELEDEPSEGYTCSSSSEETARLSVFASFVLQLPESLSHEMGDGASHSTRARVVAEVECHWDAIHIVLLKVYRTICLTRTALSVSAAWPEPLSSHRIFWELVPARVGFLAQPALVFLTSHLSCAFERLHLYTLRSAHGWKEWSEAQMFSSGHDTVYTPLRYAKHHMPWMSHACRHSVLNGLLLITLLWSEQYFNVAHRSPLQQCFPLLSSVGGGEEADDVLRRLFGFSYSTTPLRMTKYSHKGTPLQEDRGGPSMPLAFTRGSFSLWRHRRRYLPYYIHLLNSFLSALQDLGQEVQHQRVQYMTLFASRRAAYESEAERATSSSATRRYRTEAWHQHKALLRQEQEARAMPLLDRLLPHGVVAVNAESFRRLVRHFLEGGRPYIAIRLSAQSVRVMRVVRRAAKQPLPELMKTSKMVHKRVQSRKDPYKKHVVRQSVPVYRLVGGGDAAAVHLPSSSSAGLQLPPLLYEMQEGVVTEIVRLGLRMGEAGTALADGMLRECVAGDVVDFLNATVGEGTQQERRDGRGATIRGVPACRALPFCTLMETIRYATTGTSPGRHLSWSSADLGMGVVALLLDLMMGEEGASWLEERKRGGALSDGEEIRVGRRVAPTARLMEIALMHSLVPCAAPDPTTTQEAKEGSRAPRKVAAVSDVSWGRRIYDYLLLDPAGLLTPQVLFAVQASRLQHHPRHAVEGLCWLLEKTISGAPSSSYSFNKENRHLHMTNHTGMSSRQFLSPAIAIRALQRQLASLPDLSTSVFEIPHARRGKSTGTPTSLEATKQFLRGQSEEGRSDDSRTDSAERETAHRTQTPRDSYTRLLQETQRALVGGLCSRLPVDRSLWAMCAATFLHIAASPSPSRCVPSHRLYSNGTLHDVLPTRLWQWMLWWSVAVCDTERSSLPIFTTTKPEVIGHGGAGDTGVALHTWMEHHCRLLVLSEWFSDDRKANSKSKQSSPWSPFIMAPSTAVSGGRRRGLAVWAALQTSVWSHLLHQAQKERSVSPQNETTRTKQRRLAEYTPEEVLALGFGTGETPSVCQWYYESQVQKPLGATAFDPSFVQRFHALMVKWEALLSDTTTRPKGEASSANHDNNEDSVLCSSLLWQHTFASFFVDVTNAPAPPSTQEPPLQESAAALAMVWLLCTVFSPRPCHLHWMKSYLYPPETTSTHHTKLWRVWMEYLKSNQESSR